MTGDGRKGLTVMPGAKEPEQPRDPATDIGHYFEQGVLDRHTSLLAARALSVALNDELLRLGVEVDPTTGKVTVRRAG